MSEAAEGLGQEDFIFLSPSFCQSARRLGRNLRAVREATNSVRGYGRKIRQRSAGGRESSEFLAK
jgi:hypothetical protein